MDRFAGQTVFVTGGNKGIGRGIAARFAREGARVAIAAIDADTPDAAKALAAETGAEVLGLVLDVSDAAAVGAAGVPRLTSSSAGMSVYSCIAIG